MWPMVGGLEITASATNGLASSSKGSGSVMAGKQERIISFTMADFSGNNCGFIASPNTEPPVLTCCVITGANKISENSFNNNYCNITISY